MTALTVKEVSDERSVSFSIFNPDCHDDHDGSGGENDANDNDDNRFC